MAGAMCPLGPVSRSQTANHEPRTENREPRTENSPPPDILPTVDERDARTEVCRIGRRLWDRHLVGAAEGNITVRLASDRILGTPSGSSLGHLLESDLVVTDMGGFPIGAGKPSSELKLHLQCYVSRPDCHAVIHAHPLTATAFTLVGETIPDDLMPEAAYVLGPVVNVPFAMPTTEEVPRAVEPFLASHKTLLLSHHGAVVLGKDLADAYNRMETLERIAKIVFMARTLSTPLPMPSATFEAIRRVALNGDL